MKRGFTLVEMLVVVVVLAILTTVVFRLADVGRDSTRRSITVTRLQRIENALSGYYAAFGIYPPVPMQGSRDIYTKVNNGVQIEGRDDSTLSADRVEAACRSQPFGAYFPFSDDRVKMVESSSDATTELIRSKVISPKESTKRIFDSGGYSDGVSKYPGAFEHEGYKWWGSKNVQLWRYGVMSFLLPRYKFMISQSKVFEVGAYAQWTEYNALPFDPETGVLYGSVGDAGEADAQKGWKALRNDMDEKRNDWKRETIPSQAACMRWIANLEGICAGNYDRTFWDVNIRGGDDKFNTKIGSINIMNPDSMQFYSPNGASSESGGVSQPYILDVITIRDGWANEFYYYSPVPFQSYRVWSSGPNGKTFPPWVDLKSLNSADAKKALEWMADDIAGMKN